MLAALVKYDENNLKALKSLARTASGAGRSGRGARGHALEFLCQSV